MADVKVIKAECTPEFKEKLREFLKKKGESEATVLKRAVKNYIEANSAPKLP